MLRSREAIREKSNIFEEYATVRSARLFPLQDFRGTLLAHTTPLKTGTRMAPQGAPAGMSVPEARRFLRCFPEVTKYAEGRAMAQGDEIRVQSIS